MVYFVPAAIWAIPDTLTSHSGSNPLDQQLDLHIAPKHPTPPIASDNSSNCLEPNKPSISLHNLPENTLLRILLQLMLTIEIDGIDCCDVLLGYMGGFGVVGTGLQVGV